MYTAFDSVVIVNDALNFTYRTVPLASMNFADTKIWGGQITGITVSGYKNQKNVVLLYDFYQNTWLLKRLIKMLSINGWNVLALDVGQLITPEKSYGQPVYIVLSGLVNGFFDG